MVGINSNKFHKCWCLFACTLIFCQNGGKYRKNNKEPYSWPIRARHVDINMDQRENPFISSPTPRSQCIFMTKVHKETSPPNLGPIGHKKGSIDPRPRGFDRSPMKPKQGQIWWVCSLLLLEEDLDREH